MTDLNNSKDDFDWDSNSWTVIDRFFKQDNILINHHINSFNYFMNHQLQEIIKEKEFNPIKIYDKNSWNETVQLYTRTYQIEFGKIYISKPVLIDSPNKPMYPHEARLRKLTYGANLYIDIYHKTLTINTNDPENIKTEVNQHETLEKYPCGRMPIMVGSKYCILSEQTNLTKMEMGEGIYDHGGYFIVKGSEKVIICQEKKCENKICCFKQKNNQSKYSEMAEISCIHPTNQSKVTSVYVKMKAKEESYGGNVIRVRIQKMKQDIPLVIIFRALNFIKDKAIVELIVYDTNNENNNSMMELLKASIEEGKPINSQKIALEYISKYVTNIQSNKYKTNTCKLKYTYETLCSELFPHVGESPIKKAFFLGYMVNKLLKCHLGLVDYDDRDSFLNKRVETSGDLMSQLFRAYFGKFIKDLKTTCDKDMIANKFDDLHLNLSKKLKPNSIENDIKYALGTGNWGLKNQAKSRKGIAAVLQRLTYLGTLSNLRRIVAPIDKNGKLTDPRKLHCTQWGVICPFETPEGGSIGIVKNMALTCQITIPCSDEPIKSYLDEYGVLSLESIHPTTVFDTVKVFVNGDWYGQSTDPKGLIDNVRMLRRNGIINPFISIAWYIHYNEIQIWTDGGRLCRPLYIIKNNQFVITDKIVTKIEKEKLMWNQILQMDHFTDKKGNEMSDKALIEYVDVNEADTIMICMSKDNLLKNTRDNYSFYHYTHCEIHPSLMLGVLACNIPFPEHNQAPRNLYQGAMGKQAMGIYSTAFRHRMDTMAHILHYPQKPIVNTETSKYIYSDNLPSGQMPIVAIACYTGYNQEDSLIFNQGAIDRGLFKSSFYRTYMDEEKKNSATLEDEKFCKPQKYYPNGKVYTEKMSYGSYEKLDTNGIVKLNSYVDGNDIIIGKVTMLKDVIEGEPKARDLSTSIRSNESGIVDKIYKNSNGDGYNFVKVRVRSDRIPEIGDKLASRHGQKGTIGLTYNQEDMPYTKDGIVPDLIVNPNAIPKRMTIAQLIECVFGKVGCVAGSELDATPFRKVDVEDISEIMEKLGYHGSGTEILYNGKTGEMMTAAIFIGPTFYYRLKHLVEDKLHSRATGPYQLLTMQPAEGRSRDGGFRFGEMERDCLWSYCRITINNSLNFFIKDMECEKTSKNGISEILGYSTDTKFLVPCKQTGFLYKGVRKCIELTLQDGKKMICTPNHKILTSNDEWVEAQNLVINETRVKASVEYPVVELDKEVEECNGWNFEAGETLLFTSDKKELLRTFAFMRILGYLITDGSIWKKNNSCGSTIFMGHHLDVKSINNDLKYFCKINENIKMGTRTFSVRLPSHFVKDILTMDGIIYGRRVNQAASLPAFILDPDCPRPIVREFLGGMFGGDGHTCLLALHRGKRDNVSSVGFSQTKNIEHLDSLQQMMYDIKYLLVRCGLKEEGITIQEAKITTHSKENGKNNYQIPLHVCVDQLIPFHDKIGFRHCCHKTQRLEAAVSHRRLKEEITRQKMWIIKRVGEITNFEEFKRLNPNKNLPTTKAIEKATEELLEKEPLVHPFVKPNRGQVAYYFNRSQKSDEFKFNDDSLLAENFLNEIGALDWFLEDEERMKPEQKTEKRKVTEKLLEEIDDPELLQDENIQEILQKHAVSYGIPRDATGLPTMNLKVIGIRDAGEHPVYDIEVEDTHSFVANGIVVHNCMLSHGSVQFLKERTFDSSDKYYVWIDDETGIISPVNPEKGIYKSLYSTNTTKFSKVQIPYSSKLLIQELMAMHIVPRIFTNKK